MKRADLVALEGVLMKEVVKRRQLGGYSADAEGILTIAEASLRILQHLIETYPESKSGRSKTNSNETD